MDPEPESEPEHDNKNINNENNVLVFENEALEDEEPRLKYQRQRTIYNNLKEFWKMLIIG